MVAHEPADPVDAFVQRYEQFRLELDDAEMRCFDWLIERARRYQRALARRPQSDFERPILLLMIMEVSPSKPRRGRNSVKLRRRFAKPGKA